jgi:hypothetical protein
METAAKSIVRWYGCLYFGQGELNEGLLALNLIALNLSLLIRDADFLSYPYQVWQ